MQDPDSIAFSQSVEKRRLVAELAAERYKNRLATTRLTLLQPAYEEARVVLGTLQNNSFWRLRQAWFALKQRLGISQVGAAAVYHPPPLAADIPLDRYELWRLEHDLRPADISWMRLAHDALRDRPRLSILLPVYNPPEAYLRSTLDSVIAQIYPHWELCIADDASTEPSVARVLSEYSASDSRIRVEYRKTNGHISAASNTALAMATGDFVALLDHDDVLSADALFMNVLMMNARPDVDMLYSDEDKIDDSGRRSSPYFKPDWSPDSLLSRMYTCHLGVYRTSLVRKIGGFREGFEGSQDYDLVLRLTEQTTAIEHIPRILYHWRLHDGSTTTAMTVKPYAQEAGVRALRDALARRAQDGVVIPTAGQSGAYTIRYALDSAKKVSVIVLHQDAGPELGRCLKSLFEKTAYPYFEAIVLDASGRAEDVLSGVPLPDRPRIRLVRCDANMNGSQHYNFGASLATGTYLLFLASRSEIVDAEWMTALVEHAQRESVGAAGAKILYHDGRLHHAGLVIGLGGIAGCGHRYAPGDTRGYFNAVGSVSNVSAVLWECLIIARKRFDSLGGFDPQLTIEFSGVDLCLRLLERGYRNVYVAHACLMTAKSPAALQRDTVADAGDREQQALLERRWALKRSSDPYYNPNLTLLREDYSPAP